jgi:hypothetical protein
VVADGVTRTTTASPWTPEDQALMMAWREHRDGLHDACGQPLAISSHPFMEGWYDPEQLVCWACTAMAEPGEDGTRKPVVLPSVVDTRDHVHDPLPPLPLATT